MAVTDKSRVVKTLAVLRLQDISSGYTRKVRSNGERRTIGGVDREFQTDASHRARAAAWIRLEGWPAAENPDFRALLRRKQQLRLEREDAARDQQPANYPE